MICCRCWGNENWVFFDYIKYLTVKFYYDTLNLIESDSKVNNQFVIEQH